LGLPVSSWISDKQEAFVAGIAEVFPGVPHGYCENHFLRDLAKPLLEQDSHAKVQMRRKVRGLRTIEQAVLRDEARKIAVSEGSAVAPPAADPNGDASAAAVAAELPPGEQAFARGFSSVAEPPAAEPSPAGQVVLDYCAAVRGILNDDQGGPLHPPGLRMADALKEVRASLERNLGTKKGGPQSSRCSV
jgi:hypothetical protein